MDSIIRKAIEDVLGELHLEEVLFAVEHPADSTHGDYATNVAMVCAKKMGKNPREIAEQFLGVLTGKIESVTSIEIAGPGFLNFRLDREYFAKRIADIRTHANTWGMNDSWKGKTVLVEYTDPNPFKEFHIGHFFANTVGEAIARLFVANGALVKRINYQGDVGLHVAHALWGMQELGMTAETDITARDLGRAYAHGATAYKSGNERAIEEIRAINKKVYDRNDEVINALYDKGRALSLGYFETIYKSIGTQFDTYFFESETGPRGRDLVISYPEIFPESEGAHIFNGEAYGLHTRVFINKEGLPTYEAKELALAKIKEERLGNYDLSVISTANEVSEYFKVLKKAMSFVFPELEKKTEHIGHGTVRLTTGKMSSRTGDVIPALDFIDEVADMASTKMTQGGKIAPSNVLAHDIAIAAIKYAILKSNILQDSVFDKDQALSFEGDSGPYLQYTYARITSVIQKANESGINGDIHTIPKDVYDVERLVYQYEEVVRNALSERAPHKIATYLKELAGAFNTFYGVEKIADASDPYATYKVALSDAVRITLKNGLNLLGIRSPEQM